MQKNPYAAALGKLGGKSTSEAKRKAVRENGRLGGRPKKVLPKMPEGKADHRVLSKKVKEEKL